MPNGVEKNLSRLQIACAVYRTRYREWPAQARMSGLILWDLANLLDDRNFELLCARIRLRTRDKLGLSVGGANGVVEYDGAGDSDDATLDLTRQWLGVVPKQHD